MLAEIVLRFELRLYNWLDRRLFHNPSCEAKLQHENAPELIEVSDDYVAKSDEDVLTLWTIASGKERRYLLQNKAQA